MPRCRAYTKGTRLSKRTVHYYLIPGDERSPNTFGGWAASFSKHRSLLIGVGLVKHKYIFSFSAVVVQVFKPQLFTFSSQVLTLLKFLSIFFFFRTQIRIFREERSKNKNKTKSPEKKKKGYSSKLSYVHQKGNLYRSVQRV